MTIDFTRRYATKDSYNKFNGLNCSLCDGPLITLLFSDQSVNHINCKKCDYTIFCFADMYGCMAVDSVTIQKFSFVSRKTDISVCPLGVFDAHYIPFQDSPILSFVVVKEAIASGRLNALCNKALNVTTKRNTMYV